MDDININAVCLSDLKVGEIAIVVGFSSEDIPTKLYEIGIVPGAQLLVYKKAPFNGPVCISMGKEECKLALRMNEANVVLVQKVE